MFHLDIAIPPADHPSRRPLRGLLRMRSVTDLILRRPRSGRLEGWPHSNCLIHHCSHLTMVTLVTLQFAAPAGQVAVLTSRDDQLADLARISEDHVGPVAQHSGSKERGRPFFR